MSKKKLILSMAMMLCIGSSFPLNVNGANTTATTRVEQDIQQATEAYLISPDGDRIPLDIVGVDVVQISNQANYRALNSENMAVVYAATVKTKTGTSSYTKYGIDADSAMTMTWSDGPRTDNKITNLQGYFSVASGDFISGEVFWGSTYTGPTWAPHSVDVDDSFDIDLNYSSTDTTAGKLRADSIGYIKSPKDGKTYQLTLKVSPTILD